MWTYSTRRLGFLALKNYEYSLLNVNRSITYR